MSISIHFQGGPGLNTAAITTLLGDWAHLGSDCQYTIQSAPEEPLCVHLYRYGYSTRGIYLSEEPEQGRYQLEMKVFANLPDREIMAWLLHAFQAEFRPKFLEEDGGLLTRSADSVLEKRFAPEDLIDAVRMVVQLARVNHYIELPGVVRSWCLGPDYLESVPKDMPDAELAETLWDVFVRSQYAYPDLRYSSPALINGFEHRYQLLGPELDTRLIAAGDRYAYATDRLIAFIDFYSLRDILPPVWVLFDQRQIMVKRPLTESETYALESNLVTLGTESQEQLEVILQANKQIVATQKGLRV